MTPAIHQMYASQQHKDSRKPTDTLTHMRKKKKNGEGRVKQVNAVMLVSMFTRKEQEKGGGSIAL